MAKANKKPATEESNETKEVKTEMKQGKFKKHEHLKAFLEQNPHVTALHIDHSTGDYWLRERPGLSEHSREEILNA